MDQDRENKSESLDENNKQGTREIYTDQINFQLIDKDDEEADRDLEEIQETYEEGTLLDKQDQDKEVEENGLIRKEEHTSYYRNPYNYREEKPKRRGHFSYFLVALVAALIGGLIGSYIAPVYLYGRVFPTPNIYQGAGDNIERINITPRDDIYVASAVAQKATKTVVEITTIETQRDLFSGQRDVQGVGSGVIIDSNGYILTNSHVIGDGNARSITVQFENGDKRDGQVLWNDPALDLAVVKVNATRLPVADLGDSDNLIIGEPVVAIGNPLGLGLQRTVTSGIVSGLNRTIRVDRYNTIEDLIQTNASINPGNSGGPLLNDRGEVIGINTAKIQSAEGLGFAIPINLARPIIEQVIREGNFKTVTMGIVGVEVATYEARLGIKLKADSGIIIIEVQPDSPAQVAGLQAGDVLQRIDNKIIDSMLTLRRTLYGYKPGDSANLSVMRNGQLQQMEITFVEN